MIDDEGPQNFILGAEESYGFLAGDHARDKNAAVAAMLLAELTARAKAEGLSLHEKLDFVDAPLRLPRRAGILAEDARLGRDGTHAAGDGPFSDRPPIAAGGLAVAQIATTGTDHAKWAGDSAPWPGPRGTW